MTTYRTSEAGLAALMRWGGATPWAKVGEAIDTAVERGWLVPVESETETERLQEQLVRTQVELSHARSQLIDREAALLAAKIAHYECDDSYYTCPAYDWEEDQKRVDRGETTYYDWPRERPKCDCGADAHNARIDAVLKGLG